MAMITMSQPKYPGLEGVDILEDKRKEKCVILMSITEPITLQISKFMVMLEL